MRAGRDVDQIVLAVRIERVAAREVVQGAVHEPEVPGIAEVHDVGTHVGFRRLRPDVIRHDVHERPLVTAVQQLQPVDDQVAVPAEIHRRPPDVPALGPAPAIEHRPDNPEDNRVLYHRVSSFIS